MKRILVKYYSPQEIGAEDEHFTKEELIENCFKVNEYIDEPSALNAYAETPATWSTLLDDTVLLFDAKELHEFLDNAVKAIEKHNFDWLEQYFT
jgi:hypothetical protein